MQRSPRDFEAQAGQQPIAMHGNSHLATLDRGVIMMRCAIRAGIETVERYTTRAEPPKPIYARETPARPILIRHCYAHARTAY